MGGYATKQRKLLIDFFEHHPDEPLSASQIEEALKQQDISLSAIYRNLGYLEEDGILRKSTKPKSREVFYQYLVAKTCKGALHIACRKCGKIYHLSSKTADLIEEKIFANENFVLDRSETVLQGLCKDCQQ